MKTSNPETYTMPVSTLDGEFVARYSETGLCRLEFPSGAKRMPASGGVAQPPTQVLKWHRTTSKALASILAGRDPGVLPPLDLSAGTVFQQSVWRTLCRIGCGRAWSYKEVARAIGRPKAVRAVGGACGANPIPVLVPCHRVLAANYGLGGFSAGLDWKRRLLEREGVQVKVPKPRIQAPNSREARTHAG